MISHSALQKALTYNPLTGIFCWDSARPKIRVGQQAGHLKKPQGYIYIEINGKCYSAHRLAWFYCNKEWPTGQIDHKNRNRADNRIDNLRIATNGQNRANSKTTNKHGLKGVFHCGWLKTKPWKSSIKHMGNVIYLGLFATKEEAHSAYKNAARKLHGEFSNP